MKPSFFSETDLKQCLMNLQFCFAGFIRDLIERKQLIKAVRLICTFKLTDRFPPVVLLNKYVEDARKSFRAIWPGKKTIYERVPLLLLYIQ